MDVKITEQQLRALRHRAEEAFGWSNERVKALALVAIAHEISALRQTLVEGIASNRDHELRLEDIEARLGL